jgi:hypothetical protein
MSLLWLIHLDDPAAGARERRPRTAYLMGSIASEPDPDPRSKNAGP